MPYSQLVSAHIAGISELLKSRGARTLMWHDMLLDRADPRWKGFTAHGDAETAKLAQLLPKDLVVCDWFYHGVPAGGKYPTLDYLSKDCGFDTLTCPWKDLKGIRGQALHAQANGLCGLLQTIWHHFGGQRFPMMVQTAACAAWGGDERLNNGHFASIWRQAGWDMGAAGYTDAGWYDTQVSRDILER